MGRCGAHDDAKRIITFVTKTGIGPFSALNTIQWQYLSIQHTHKTKQKFLLGSVFRPELSPSFALLSMDYLHALFLSMSMSTSQQTTLKGMFDCHT